MRKKGEEIQAFICYTPKRTSFKKFVEIASIRWQIEQSFEEAKGEVGLDQYEVRSYAGWYKHITMSMCALSILASIKKNLAEIQEAIGQNEKGSMNKFKKGRNVRWYRYPKTSSENLCIISH